MAFARRATTAFLADIPLECVCQQATPGGNHALWIAGHLAWTDAFWLAELAQHAGRLRDDWCAAFSRGSRPLPTAAAYPPFPDVMQRMQHLREELLAWFQSLDAAQLSQPLPARLANFAPSHAALPGTVAWHEGLHAGQLTVIRRSLGLAPRFA